MFWGTGVEVSVAAGSGFVARLHLGRFVDGGMERLGLGMRLCWRILFSSGTGGVWSSGRERSFWMPRAGWVDGWCMERS